MLLILASELSRRNTQRAIAHGIKSVCEEKNERFSFESTIIHSRDSHRSLNLLLLNLSVKKKNEGERLSSIIIIIFVVMINIREPHSGIISFNFVVNIGIRISFFYSSIFCSGVVKIDIRII